MNENLFEVALRNNDASKFFKGEDGYFLRNPETGGHSFYVHMSGWVVNYIKQNEYGLMEFKDAFEVFMKSSDPSSEADFECVMENVFSYISLRGQGLIHDCVSFGSDEDRLFSAFKDFFENAKRCYFYKRWKSYVKGFCEYCRLHKEPKLASLVCS